MTKREEILNAIQKGILRGYHDGPESYIDIPEELQSNHELVDKSIPMKVLVYGYYALPGSSR